jgi:uncharacterized membrane protein
MKAIVRNILLACLISMFAFFGAVGRKHSKTQMSPAQQAEARKETLTCLSVAFLACGLCAWRCIVLNRRLNEEREYPRRFNEYMRNSAFNRHY